MRNDNQITDFIEKCKNIDFSAESINQEKNLEVLKSKLKNIENEREIYMNRKVRKPIAIVAVVSALFCLSMAVYGQDLIRTVRTITLGDYVEYIVVEDMRETETILQQNESDLELYDADGNLLTEIPESGVMYTADGEEVRIVTDMNQEFETFDFYDIEEGVLHFINEVSLPSYLPIGYEFDKISYFSDPTDESFIAEGGNKYMGIYYSDGVNQIYSQIRYMSEETAFASSAEDDIQLVEINGHNAVIHANSLDIQIGDVLYMFFGNDNLNVDELIKIAESL